MQSFRWSCLKQRLAKQRTMGVDYFLFRWAKNLSQNHSHVYSNFCWKWKRTWKIKIKLTTGENFFLVLTSNLSLIRATCTKQISPRTSIYTIPQSFQKDHYNRCITLNLQNIESVWVIDVWKWDLLLREKSSLYTRKNDIGINIRGFEINYSCFYLQNSC